MPLSPEEIQILTDIRFDASVFQSVEDVCHKRLDRLMCIDPARGTLHPGPGISWTVADGDEAEELMGIVSPLLQPHGYRAFWSVRRNPNGHPLTDELAVVKNDDPFAMVRLRFTDGANYGISTTDIIDRLIAWQQICDFTIVGASHDWVAMVFSRLPERICAFAEEVYLFCPDCVEQGVGLFRDENKEQETFASARRLCPDVSNAVRQHKEKLLAQAIATLPPDAVERFKSLMEAAGESDSSEMGIRLLAQDILQREYLFLWWD